MKTTKLDLILFAPVYFQLMYWTFGDNPSHMLLVNGIVLVALFAINIVLKFSNHKKLVIKEN